MNIARSCDAPGLGDEGMGLKAATPALDGATEEHIREA